MDSSERVLDELIGDLSASFKEDLRKVLGLWKRMGLSDTQVKQRHETVIEQLTSVTKNMVEEETSNEVKIMMICEKHLANISSLWSQMECDGEPLEKDFNHLSLLRREKYLRDKFELLSKEKTRRLTEEKILIKENYDLSTLLGVPCITVVEDTLLTDNERIELENHIGDMKEMKEERETHMLNMKEEILRLLDQLEIDLNTTSLAEFITEDESKSLTQSDLKSVQVSMVELKKQLEEKQRGAEMLAEEICSLYEKLKVSKDLRLPLATGQVCPFSELHKSEHLLLLEDEMRNLKVEKRKQIKVLLENARGELDELWEKCMTPEEEREEFLVQLEGYTEETLDEIEEKIKTMKEFYESNFEVFSKYKKLLSLWESVRDLDAKSRDPNRLLKSRGNALFKEEKERKQIGQLLPKIEQELLVLAETNEADYGEVLAIGKVPIFNIIENLRTKHAQQLKNISVDLRVANKTNDVTTLNNNKSIKSKSFLSGTLAKLRSTRVTSPRMRPNSPIAANLQRSRSRISPMAFSPARCKPQSGAGASNRTLKVPSMAFDSETAEDLSFHPDASSVMSSTIIGNKSVGPKKSPLFSSTRPVGENNSLKRKTPLNNSLTGAKKSRFGFSMKRRSISLAEDTPTSRSGVRKGEPSKLFHGGGSGVKSGGRKGLVRSDSTLSSISQTSSASSTATSWKSSVLGRSMKKFGSTMGSKYDSTSSLRQGFPADSTNSLLHGSSSRIKNSTNATQTSLRGTGLPTRNNVTVNLAKGPVLR